MMTKEAAPSVDTIAAAVRNFYEQYPYPAPIETLEKYQVRAGDMPERRAEHHLFWPARRIRTNRSILIAGCGTSQAARHAMKWPQARIVGIDVSETSIESTRALKEKHGLANLELRQLPVEHAGQLGESFDQVICTGVLHHLADPDLGLRSLRNVLAPGGAMNLMVYAPYGRAGIYLLQDYNRRLDIGTSSVEIEELVATLKLLPAAHPLWPLLRDSPDFRYEAGLADALLHPQDRPYSVPQFLSFLTRSGLRFGRWLRQAPYLPHCGAMRQTPHYARLADLPAAEQYAAMELFRGSMVRHSAIVYRDEDDPAMQTIAFDDEQWLDYIPIRLPEAICVTERLPKGAAGVLINRLHTDVDIYLAIDANQRDLLAAIDGQRSIRDVLPKDMSAQQARTFFQQLWRHDQIVFNTGSRETPLKETSLKEASLKGLAESS